MNNRLSHTSSTPSSGGQEALPIILPPSPYGKAQVTLYVRDSNVWLNQNQPAELFATSKQNICLFTINTLTNRELKRISIVKKHLITAPNGKLYSVFLYRIMFIIILLFYATSTRISAEEKPNTDSILNNATRAAEKYSRFIKHYDADVYMRTYVSALKKNFLYKYTYRIPNFVLYDRNRDEALIESFSRMEYDFPDNYEHNVLNFNGTLTSRSDVWMLPFNLLSVNIYSEVTNDESFIMPLRTNNKRYYTYALQNSYTSDGKTYYTFRFYPAYSSSKLLMGTFTVEEGSWRVSNFLGIGKDLFADFSFNIKMGKNGWEKYLPVEFSIHRTHSYLGNKVQNRYLVGIRYNKIEEKKDENDKPKTYDIGNRYKVRLDSIRLSTESRFWDSIRKIPLFENEKKLLEDLKRNRQEKRNTEEKSDSAAAGNKAMELIGQSLIADTRYWYKKTEINYSGLLNPSMLSYSTQDGLNYRLRLSFKTHLVRDKSLSISSYAGYAVKYKDLTADLSIRLQYSPGGLGVVSLSAGKGNRAFSSSFIQEVQDSLTAKGLKFEDMFVNFYKDYYLRLFNNIELFNGFQLGTGIDYHIRQGAKKTENVDVISEDKVLDVRRYFVPTLRLTWTPAQYYRREGYEKIYEHSNYPTFKAEFARSFKDIFASTSEYNRWEFDMNQNVKIGQLRSIRYHVGTGSYSRHQTDFFADFSHFAPYNFPQTWHDGIGGVFNLLPYNVYNASTSYVQAHVMYETPFLIFTLLPKLSRGILSERLYVSQLYTPYIVSYSEIGYGIGNRYVNAAVFFSFHKVKFQQIGGKVIFLL